MKLRETLDSALHHFLRGPSRWLWIAAVALATALLAVPATRLGIESDNQSLLSKDPVGARAYAEFKAAFGNDEDLFVALSHPNLLERDGLALVAELTDEIGSVDGVRHVWSLTSAEEIVAGPVGAEPAPLVPRPLDRGDLTAGVTMALDRNPELTGWIVSRDRRTAGFLVEIEDRPGDTEYRSGIVERIRAMGDRLAKRGSEPGVALHLAGVAVQKHDVSDYVARDQRVLLPLAVVVLAITLGAFFRRLDGIVLPLGVAGVTVLWTLGAYAASGFALNAITSLLPPVLLVVALAASVHVYDAWREGHGDGSGGDAVTRVAAAVRAVAVPAALCAVTTAQGFLSLAVSEMPAVRQFGMFAAFGVVVSFVVGMTVVPAILTLLRAPPRPATAEHGLTIRLLEASASLATTWPRAVLAVFALVTFVAAGGIPLVRSNTDLVGFLAADSALRRDTEIIDAELGGAAALEFMLRSRDGGSPVGLDALRRLATLESAVRTLPHVSGATSMTALLGQVHRAQAGTATASLPDNPEDLAEYLDLLQESGHPLVRRFLSGDRSAVRLTVRMLAVGTAESTPVVASILESGRQFLGDAYELVPTGALYHVVRDSNRLVAQQTKSFAAAIVMVVLAIGLLFRSLTFTFVALIPNVMPIVWTGGLMGYLGIELSTGTAMIASAVLGLVVDDTIHFLSHYRRAYRGDAAAAVRIATREVGAPVTVAAVSLVLGFWVGALGSFQPTIYFSLLSGLTMITGVLCDLLVLPAALVLLDPGEGNK